MSTIGAIVPLMEYTDSKTIIFGWSIGKDCKHFSKSIISLCLKINFWAPLALIPSIIDAWLFSSEIKTSSGKILPRVLSAVKLAK